MLSFIVSFGFTTPQIYSSLDYEDQSGWKRVVKMEVVESRESLFESLLISSLLSAYAYMQYAEHGSCLELVKGGCNLPELPLLLNQHPFIFFNGRACILLFTEYQFDLQISNVLRGVLYIW